MYVVIKYLALGCMTLHKVARPRSGVYTCSIIAPKARGDRNSIQ